MSKNQANINKLVLQNSLKVVLRTHIEWLTEKRIIEIELVIELGVFSVCPSELPHVYCYIKYLLIEEPW